MIRALGIALSSFELLAFGYGSVVVYQNRDLWGAFWFYVFLSTAALSVFGFVLRLRERSIAREIAEAEEKLTKRVLRRVAKTYTLPEIVAAAVDAENKLRTSSVAAVPRIAAEQESREQNAIEKA